MKNLRVVLDDYEFFVRPDGIGMDVRFFLLLNISHE